jgi:hypothetical protein
MHTQSRQDGNTLVVFSNNGSLSILVSDAAT